MNLQTAPTAGPAPSTRRHGPVAASAGRLALGWSLLAAEVALAATAAASCMLFTDFGVLVTVVVVALLMWDLTLLVETGHGGAWRLAGIRLLARADDAPLGAARASKLTAAHLTVSRNVPDAVDPRLAPTRLRATSSARPEPARPAAPAVVADQATAVDGLIAPPPGSRTTVPPAPVRERAGHARVTVDGQSHHMLVAVAIVGRRPQAERPGDTLITVTDLTRTLSRSHVRLELAADGIILATDLGSTNGSAIVTADGARTELTPGIASAVAPGSVLTFGDHSLTITHGGA